MADDPRRFEDLVETIRSLRAQLDGVQSTLLNRMATHTHAGGGGGGVTDHGALTGLADDDHTQYHNDTRGDVRYYTKTAADTLLAGKAATSHGHSGADITSGTVDIARLPTGSTGTTVPLGNHTHDHGAITGLGDDDHPQYVLANGTRAITGDQVIQGTGKAYRLRRSGAALDLEYGGADMHLSGWTNDDFTGTQKTNAIFKRSGLLEVENLTHNATGFAAVTTQQDTSSTSYADLSTTGPAVSVTLPAAQDVLVIIRSRMGNTSTSGSVYASYAVSGATTESADDRKSVTHNGSGNAEQYANFWVTACNAGTTTFTMKYRVVSGTGRYLDRMIVAIPL